MDTRWPDHPDSYVSARQVATKLGYVTMKAFYAARPQLDARGFPEPALPRRWRASQVEQWEAWNAAQRSLRVPLDAHKPANDIAPPRAPALRPTQSPARQRLAQMRAARS